MKDALPDRVPVATAEPKEGPCGVSEGCIGDEGSSRSKSREDDAESR